jgi:hypothetical protein
MAGNVHEWCWDWFDPSWCGNLAGTQNDTHGPEAPPLGFRALRGGGCWYNDASIARTATRTGGAPKDGDSHVGFRTVQPVDRPWMVQGAVAASRLFSNLGRLRGEIRGRALPFADGHRLGAGLTVRAWFGLRDGSCSRAEQIPGAGAGGVATRPPESATEHGTGPSDVSA